MDAKRGEHRPVVLAAVGALVLLVGSLLTQSGWVAARADDAGVDLGVEITPLGEDQQSEAAPTPSDGPSFVGPSPTGTESATSGPSVTGGPTATGAPSDAGKPTSGASKTGAAAGDGSLPWTGSAIGAVAILALAALTIGASLVRSSRRRQAR
ncbi:MAG: hypothetical protein LBK59_06500 [Bifidobacteriaceae bacterium]|jgi:hypothetical protein|nr:hypothetical protein [Bifidobacteriaceae bacterium]